MRVYAVEHLESGEVVYCPDKESAVDTLAICLRKQERRPVTERESVTISSVKLSKREWDEMEDVPDGEC